MSINLGMPAPLRGAYQKELDQHYRFRAAGQHKQAWRHLERAHILGQRYPYHHSKAHWLMLRLAFFDKNLPEVMGQIPRLLVGGLKSFIDHIPEGNTGGSNVPPLRSMPVEEDLKEIFRQAGLRVPGLKP